MLAGFNNVRLGWNEIWYAQQWNELMGNGGRPFDGPLLVLIGTKDSNRPITSTDPVVKQTWEKYPESPLGYYIFEGSQHVPTLFAVQKIWLDWVADRFNSKDVPQGCQNTTITLARPVVDYQQNWNWFLEYALWSYETFQKYEVDYLPLA